MSTAHPELPRRSFAVIMTFIIGLAIVGYLVGIHDGVPREDVQRPAAHSLYVPPTDSAHVTNSSAATHRDGAIHGERAIQGAAAIPAVRYSEMRRTESSLIMNLERIHTVYDYQKCITCHDPHALKIQPSDQHKRQSLSTRAARRAFNGAPPVIPHAVEQSNDAACYACHGEGAKVGQRVANRMSHGLLVNCLQCHAAPPPQLFADVEVTAENTFVGLPTPHSGERAFPGAPPVIPHSTWMRERCLSCHGGIAGWPGLEVTHRWRTNCRQCHATSANVEQAVATHDDKAVPTLVAQQP